VIRRRLSDVLLGLVLLIVCLPAFALAAAAVWLDQMLPPLVTEERLTRQGRRLRLFRFRTFRPGVFGARITPLGDFLHRWHIDEIPQLINVVTGELTFVTEGRGLNADVNRKKVFALRDS